MITKEQLINALSMYIDDYAEQDDNITIDEMIIIKKNFDRIYEDLKEEAQNTPHGEE